MSDDPNQRPTLGTELLREITRVRDEVLPIYVSIGPPGMYAAMSMRADLDEATKAIMEGDIVVMIRCYQSLREYKT